MRTHLENLPYAKNFRELVVYQKARNLAQEVFILTRVFPREEKYSLTDQILRSSRSIGAQIAEAWAKRINEKHFLSKLTDADGEQYETQHWIGVAYDCGYFSREQAEHLRTECLEIGRMLGSMQANSKKFCGAHPYEIHEQETEYFTLSEEPL